MPKVTKRNRGRSSVKVRERPNVQIVVNGETLEVPENLTVATLVEYLSLPNERTAIERNREVVRRADWPNTQLSEGDRIEIVHFVGGG